MNFSNSNSVWWVLLSIVIVVPCQVVLDKSEFGRLQFIAKHQNSELFIVAMIVIESVRVNNLRSLLKYWNTVDCLSQNKFLLDTQYKATREGERGGA